MHDLLTFLGDYWWLVLIFGGGVLDMIGETFGVGAASLQKRAKAKRRHQLELKRIELEIARAKTGSHPGVEAVTGTPKPGPCVHRNVVPVVSAADEVVAWLCKTCDEKLPANWAVREVDL